MILLQVADAARLSAAVRKATYRGKSFLLSTFRGRGNVDALLFAQSSEAQVACVAFSRGTLTSAAVRRGVRQKSTMSGLHEGSNVPSHAARPDLEAVDDCDGRGDLWAFC